MLRLERIEFAPQYIIYGHDSDGNLNKATYPDGNVVDYMHTNRHQLKEVHSAGAPPLATYAYDLAGRLVSRTLDNGVVTDYSPTQDPALGYCHRGPRRGP